MEEKIPPKKEEPVRINLSHVEEEFKKDDGTLELQVLSDGSTKSYDKEGKAVIEHKNREGTLILPTLPESAPEIKKPETEVVEVEKENPEENYTPPSGRKPGFLKRNALKIGLATGILAGGGYGVKQTVDYMDQREKHAPTKKIEQKNITAQTNKNKIYTAPTSTNLPAEATKLQEKSEKEKLAEEITAKIKAELDAKYATELAGTKTENEAMKKKLSEIEKEKSAPQTDEQFWKRLQDGVQSGKKLDDLLRNADETMRYYHLQAKGYKLY